jgi:hypothetical protein
MTEWLKAYGKIGFDAKILRQKMGEFYTKSDAASKSFIPKRLPSSTPHDTSK